MTDGANAQPDFSNLPEDVRPARGTQGLLRTGMIWLAANLVVTTLLTGTLFVPGVSFGTAFTMIVLGTVLGAGALVLIGNMGTRTGLPTMALSRGSFGIRGSLLPSAANLIILMGWSWVQAMLAGVTVDALVEQLTGFSNPALFAVICQSIVVILAVFGHELIAKVEPLFALVILAVMAYVFFTAFRQFSLEEFFAIEVDPSLGGSAMVTLDVVIATAISWTVLSADMNRHAKSSTASVVGAGVGYTLSTVTSMSLGLVAFCALLLAGKNPEVFDPSSLVVEFGAPFGIAIFLSVMATNTMVVYGMATSAVNAQLSWKLKFRPTAIALGIVSIIGSTWLALLTQFTDFLVMIGAFFVPVFAIMIVDYYVLKRRTYSYEILEETPSSRYWYSKGVNWAAIAVWVVGATLSYLWTYVFPLPIGATLPAFAVSFFLYLVAMVFFGKSARLPEPAPEGRGRRPERAGHTPQGG